MSNTGQASIEDNSTFGLVSCAVACLQCVMPTIVIAGLTLAQLLALVFIISKQSQAYGVGAEQRLTSRMSSMRAIWVKMSALWPPDFSFLSRMASSCASIQPHGRLCGPQAEGSAATSNCRIEDNCSTLISSCGHVQVVHLADDGLLPTHSAGSDRAVLGITRSDV